MDRLGLQGIHELLLLGLGGNLGQSLGSYFQYLLSLSQGTLPLLVPGWPSLPWLAESAGAYPSSIAGAPQWVDVWDLQSPQGMQLRRLSLSGSSVRDFEALSLHFYF